MPGTMKALGSCTTNTRAERPAAVRGVGFIGIGLLLSATPPMARAQSGFSHGVAAGDVTDTSAVVWTRADWLSVVRFELSTDEAFATIDQSVVVLASPDNDYVVKLALADLAPATLYFSRFVVEGDPEQRSPVGRFRTAPPADEAAALRFVFSGDMGARFGPFAVVSQAAAEQADFLVWFGDTVYADDAESAGGIATTLAEYRAKHREIRSDPHLCDALATLPVWVGWDDHEVTDNYAGADPELSPEQRAAGYQAFFDYMPIRNQQAPDDRFRTYRRFRWGSQIEFFLLDGRQYRERSAADDCRLNPDPFGVVLGPLLARESCTARLSEPRTLLGRAQFDWLTQGLLESTAAAKFVINDVPVSFLGVLPYDRWDGYDAERQALLEFIDAHEISGVIFLTTDHHSNWYNPDVLRHFRARRPDYDLASDVFVVEAIVGPLGFETAHQTAVSVGAAALGLPNGPIVQGLLSGVEGGVVHRMQCVGGFALAETNRVSYAVVDVSAEGDVSIRYRGVHPVEARGPDAAAETFYTVAVDQPPPLPCCVPLLLVALAGWPALTARRRAPGSVDH
jgi:alkaline phosphatase D